MQAACLAMPRWPLHPVGLLLVHSFYGQMAWPSIFIGWLLRALVLKYGGARVYHNARPLFIGLIVGEVLAAIFWTLVPTTLALLGKALWRHLHPTALTGSFRRRPPRQKDCFVGSGRPRGLGASSPQDLFHDPTS